MRRVLLFDVMGTLVHDPFFEEVPAFFGVSFEALLPQLEPGPWVQFERGEIDQETLLRRFFRDGRAFDHAGLVACVRAAYRYLPGVEALLTDLSAACAGEGVSMHTLSNYPPWYRMIEERLRLSDYVLWSFVSCHTGVRKPDPEAYLGAAGALGVAPAQCVFADDRGSNCEAAREVGMDTIRFEDAAQLRRELRARGLRV